jgi:hypothetical protein
MQALEHTRSVPAGFGAQRHIQTIPGVDHRDGKGERRDFRLSELRPNPFIDAIRGVSIG